MAKLGWVAFALLGAVVVAGAAISSTKDEADTKGLLTQIRDVQFRDAHPRVYKSHLFAPSTCDFSAKCDLQEEGLRQFDRALAEKKSAEERKKNADFWLTTPSLYLLDDARFAEVCESIRAVYGEEKVTEFRKKREAQLKK